MRRRWIAVITFTIAISISVSAQVLKQPKPTKPGVPHVSGAAVAAATKPIAEPFSINGRVTDNKGEAMSGVSVAATSTNKATTDNYGKYVILGLDRNRPNYQLKVSKSNYTFSPSGRTIVPPQKGDVNNVNFTGTSTAKPKA